MLDHFTSETVHNLIWLGRWDDERIARYCGIDAATVARARWLAPKGRKPSKAIHGS